MKKLLFLLLLIPSLAFGSSGATITGDVAGGSGGGGKIVQVVNFQTGEVATGTTQIPTSDSIPQNTEGDEYMTLAITPTSATNKLLIEVVMHISSLATSNATSALFQDTTADALAVMNQVVSGASHNQAISFNHYMDAGTTSETTFKVRGGTNAVQTTTFNGQNSTRLFGGVMASSITITEMTP